MTNGDVIRAMDDRTLADWIGDIEDMRGPSYCQHLPVCEAMVDADALIPLKYCRLCIEAWLGQEAGRDDV